MLLRIILAMIDAETHIQAAKVRTDSVQCRVGCIWHWDDDDDDDNGDNMVLYYDDDNDVCCLSGANTIADHGSRPRLPIAPSRARELSKRGSSPITISIR